MRTLILALTAIASMSTACVSKGDHELLQKDRDKLKAELAATQQKLNETETARQATARELQKLIDVRAGLERDLQGASSESASLKSSVDEMKRAMQELAARKAEADKRIAEFKSLAERFKKLIDAGKLRVKTVDGRMVVELATDILFPSGSAQLSKEGK